MAVSDADFRVCPSSCPRCHGEHWVDAHRLRYPALSDETTSATLPLSGHVIGTHWCVCPATAEPFYVMALVIGDATPSQALD
jgi:hypothetical protein